MPWELGYFDALKQKVAILPLVNKSDDEYKGQEYLGLYPCIHKGWYGDLYVKDEDKQIPLKTWILNN